MGGEAGGAGVFGSSSAGGGLGCGSSINDSRL